MVLYSQATRRVAEQQELEFESEYGFVVDLTDILKMPEALGLHTFKIKWKGKAPRSGN